MNSFKLTAVGNLARNPELSVKGDATFARFCLVGNDEIAVSEDGETRDVVTSLWFFAFGDIAAEIARKSRKGDQLFLEAQVVPSSWTGKLGETQHGTTYIVTGFRFGAKRGDPGASAASLRSAPPDAPPETAMAEVAC